jgi:2-polyprenyl-3-methyl-5-hydroxy-6-metoxy-1,4-benzoquinol methylase
MSFSEELYDHIACDYCGSKSYKVNYYPKTIITPENLKLSVSWAERDTQQIVECDQCQLVYVNPRLKKEIILNAYASGEETKYAEQIESRLNTFKYCFDLVEKHLPDVEGKVLDVGASGGFFLKVAQERGWFIDGVEPSRWLCAFAKEHFNIDIKNGILEQFSYPENHFDVISMWDVIEHVFSPSEEIKRMIALLKPGGILILNTPDESSMLTKLAGRRWWFYLSVHLFYFSPKTLGMILKKSGLEIVEVKPHWQIHSFGHLVKMVGLYSETLSKIAFKIIDAIGLSKIPIKYYAAQFTIVARKPQ